MRLPDVGISRRHARLDFDGSQVVLTDLGSTNGTLVNGQRILTRIGSSGNKVLTRLMGLIVMVIAVESFFAGLRPIVRSMLQTGPAAP